MDWQNERRSDNVEDLRDADPGMSGGNPFGGGMRFPMPGGPGGMLGLGGIVLVVILGLVFGFDPIQLLSGGQLAAPRPAARSHTTAEEKQLVEFVRVVLGTTEDAWKIHFERMGKRYTEPTLVLFRNVVRSACGRADAASGPFYCPGDSKLYIDLAFYDELRLRLGAPGDFAQAYVIAHEVGHHVQNLLGISERVQAQRGQLGEKEFNDLSVRLELQADYFAGVWANYAQERRLVQAGDIDEALGAAAAVGDDRLQEAAHRHVVPETFTHGTSAQRAKWFRLGFESGDPMRHDPFKVQKP